MSDLTSAVAEARDRLTQGLLGLGWDVDDQGRCFGDVCDSSGRLVAMWVEPHGGFPFMPPAVTPIDGSGTYSWHQNSDGSLCLWTPRDSGHLPWVEADALVERIEQWFVRDADGWCGDPPDLDLERYFDRAEGLVIYADLSPLMGRLLRLRRRSECFDIETGGTPRGRATEFTLGWAADLGELGSPVRNWEQIADRIGGQATQVSERARSRQPVRILLLRYTRSGEEGAIALRVTAPTNPARPLQLKAMTIARADDRTLTLRSGPHFDTLTGKRVAIVGAGAVGSLTADLLARAGVGYLRMIDGDLMRPGNSVRHLAASAYWGWNKAKAVAAIISDRYAIDADYDGEPILMPEQAEMLLTDFDLVIDATGNPWVHELIAFAARSARRSALAVYLQREGGIARIDRRPLVENENPLEAVPPGETTTPTLREGGCGDPVSAAPAWAATAAAARACATAVRLLTGQPVPATVIDVLEPQPEGRYGSISVLT